MYLLAAGTLCLFICCPGIGIENCILRIYYHPLCSWLALQIVIYLHIEQRCRQSGEGICRFCDPIYTHECKRHNPDHHQHCLESHRAILGCSPRSCSRSRQRFRFLVHVCLQSIILGCIMIHSLICSSYNCGLDYRSLKQDDLRFSGRILQHRSNFFPYSYRSRSSTGPQISRNSMGRRQRRRLRSLSQTLTHDLIGKSGKFFNDKDTRSSLRKRYSFHYKIKKRPIQLWTLKQEMETDDDHATMRESFSLVQDIVFLVTQTYFLLISRKIWLKICGKPCNLVWFFW